jgi:hypothetical protein
MKKALVTWRLTPTGEASDLWALSTHRNEVWVRAHDALEARRLTTQRFRVRANTNWSATIISAGRVASSPRANMK